LNNDNLVDIFLDKVDKWINENKLNFVRKKFDKVEEILNLLPEDMSELSTEELMQNSYCLYAYVDHVQSIYNREKTVVDFAEESISFIISPVINNYGDQFTKWQTKQTLAIKENPLAMKLNQLKNHAQSRLNMLDNKVEYIKKMADIMVEIAKRRRYDYTSNGQRAS
jgi:flagellin-specific chaperone FliS